MDIILATSKGEQIDRIIGLESGADDYVSKPFDARKTPLRVKALQRRVRVQARLKAKVSVETSLIGL